MISVRLSKVIGALAEISRSQTFVKKSAEMASELVNIHVMTGTFKTMMGNQSSYLIS